VSEPGQRDLGGRRADLPRHLVDGREHREAAVGHVALLHVRGAGRLGQVGAGAVLARQEAAPERGIGDHPHALLEAERLELALVLVAEHQVVLGLERLVARVAVLVALPQRAGEPPSDVVRATDVTNLPLAHEVVEGAQRLL
jgi:hypothetical protein